MVRAALCRIFWPVAMSPVSDTMRTSGCSTSGAPTLSPRADDIDDAAREELAGELRQAQGGERGLLGA